MLVEVSVVVPVYQVEKQLKRCIDSITGQTFKEIEIILVDDGSTDDSGNICDEYALKDARIKVLHKENGGLSSARNAGIKLANGRYIMFIDSDDEIRRDMIETMYNAAEQDGSDIVGCGYLEIDHNKRVSEKNANFPSGVYSHEDVVRKFAVEIFGDLKLMWPKKVVGYSCINLYKSSIIFDNNILFESENKYFHEDEIFLLEFICNSGKMSIVNQPFYCYYVNSNSLSHRYRKGLWDMKLALIDKFYQYSVELNVVDEYNKHIISTIYDAIRICILNEFKSGCTNSVAQTKAEISRICDNVLTRETLIKECFLDLSIADKLCFFMVKHKWAWGITLLYKAYFCTFNFLRKVKRFCVKS